MMRVILVREKSTGEIADWFRSEEDAALVYGNDGYEYAFEVCWIGSIDEE